MWLRKADGSGVINTWHVTEIIIKRSEETGRKLVAQAIMNDQNPRTIDLTGLPYAVEYGADEESASKALAEWLRNMEA